MMCWITYSCCSVSPVPTLQEVECIHVDFTLDLQSRCESIIAEYGTVFARAPVQLTAIDELPGALRVNWKEVI